MCCNPSRRGRPSVSTRVPNRPRSSRPGFSLVELIVVMVILGLLAGLVTFKARSYLIASKQNAAKTEIARIIQALDSFYAVTDRYPTNDEGLESLTQKSDGFPDGILNKVPLDPWKNPYQYNNPGRDDAPYEVMSMGADGREGGEAADEDIASYDLDEGEE